MSAPAAHRRALLAAMVLGALALRPQLVGVGPILDRIQDDLSVSHGIAGLLGTIPVLCMGLGAPWAARLAERIGLLRAIDAALVLLAVFGVLRAFAPGAAVLLALTVPIGIGMSFGNALLPLATKEAFADRPLAATGSYTTGIQVGSAVAALVAVPIAAWLGGWRWTLGAFGIGACLSALGWFVLARGHARGAATRAPRARLAWRRPIAWRLAATLGATSMIYYGIGAWLPSAFTERGWSEGSAGALVAVFNIAAVPGGLAVVLLGERLGSRRAYMMLSAALLGVGTALFILVPGGGFAWALAAGIGNGVIFPVMMTLPLDVAGGAAEVSAFSGMMLGVGYSISALSPFVLGAVRDATGSFTTSLWIVVGIATALLVNVSFLSAGRLRPRAAVAQPAT